MIDNRLVLADPEIVRVEPTLLRAPAFGSSVVGDFRWLRPAAAWSNSHFTITDSLAFGTSCFERGSAS